MSYCTLNDLIARADGGERDLIELTDRADPPAGSVDQSAIEARIADAEAEINVWLQSRYRLPFAEVPAVLKNIAVDVTLYHLYGTRVTEPIVKRYDDAVRLLKAINSGAASLGLTDTGAETLATSGGPLFAAPKRRLDAAHLADYLSEIISGRVA